MREQYMGERGNSTTSVRKVEWHDLVQVLERIVWKVAGKLEEDLVEIAGRYERLVSDEIRKLAEEGLFSGDEMLTKLKIAAEMFMDGVYEDFEKAVSRRIYWDFIDYEVGREEDYRVSGNQVVVDGFIGVGIRVKTRDDLPSYFLAYAVEYSVSIDGVKLYKAYLREVDRI